MTPRAVSEANRKQIEVASFIPGLRCCVMTGSGWVMKLHGRGPRRKLNSLMTTRELT
jgi:hypothetical protein